MKKENNPIEMKVTMTSPIDKSIAVKAKDMHGKEFIIQFDLIAQNDMVKLRIPSCGFIMDPEKEDTVLDTCKLPVEDTVNAIQLIMESYVAEPYQNKVIWMFHDAVCDYTAVEGILTELLETRVIRALQEHRKYVQPHSIQMESDWSDVYASDIMEFCDQFRPVQKRFPNTTIEIVNSMKQIGDTSGDRYVDFMNTYMELFVD